MDLFDRLQGSFATAARYVTAATAALSLVALPYMAHAKGKMQLTPAQFKAALKKAEERGRKAGCKVDKKGKPASSGKPRPRRSRKPRKSRSQRVWEQVGQHLDECAYHFISQNHRLSNEDKRFGVCLGAGPAGDFQRAGLISGSDYGLEGMCGEDSAVKCYGVKLSGAKDAADQPGVDDQTRRAIIDISLMTAGNAGKLRKLEKDVARLAKPATPTHADLDKGHKKIDKDHKGIKKQLKDISDKLKADPLYRELNLTLGMELSGHTPGLTIGAEYVSEFTKGLKFAIGGSYLLNTNEGSTTPYNNDPEFTTIHGVDSKTGNKVRTSFWRTDSGKKVTLLETHAATGYIEGRMTIFGGKSAGADLVAGLNYRIHSEGSANQGTEETWVEVVNHDNNGNALLPAEEKLRRTVNYGKSPETTTKYSFGIHGGVDVWKRWESFTGKLGLRVYHRPVGNETPGLHFVISGGLPSLKGGK